MRESGRRYAYHALRARLSEGTLKSVDYLTAGVDSEGGRTYRIHRTADDNASDGFKIAEKMGVTFRDLSRTS